MTEPIAKNVVTCRICGAPADRYSNLFQCQKNPGNIADLTTGLFEDLTRPTNNLTDKVIINSESDGIQPASPSIVR